MTLSRLKTFKPHCTVIAGDLNCKYKRFDDSTEAPSKVLLLFPLFSYRLKSNHLKSGIELGFLDIFLGHICLFPAL